MFTISLHFHLESTQKYAIKMFALIFELELFSCEISLTLTNYQTKNNSIWQKMLIILLLKATF